MNNVETAEKAARTLQPMNQTARVVAFDGDNTLWSCSPKVREWEIRIDQLACSRMLWPAMSSRFRANLHQYGFSPQGCIRALLEANSEAEISAGCWAREVGRIETLLRFELEPMSDVTKALDFFRGHHFRLWLITKGDLLKQALKLVCFKHTKAFDATEIVSSKRVHTYKEVLRRHDCPGADFTMIGDSFFQDVLPALRVGGTGIHIPSGRWRGLAGLGNMLPTWRLMTCSSLSDLPSLPML